MHVFSVQRRGFGKSQGREGEVADFIYEDYWKFMDATLAQGKFKADIPKFGFGCSFGGLILANMITQRTDFFKAVVLDVPTLGFKIY